MIVELESLPGYAGGDQDGEDGLPGREILDGVQRLPELVRVLGLGAWIEPLSAQNIDHACSRRRTRAFK